MLETALLNFTSFVIQGSSLPEINKIGKEEKLGKVQKV